MPVEEYLHCIRKVIFTDEGNCPACGKNKKDLPTISREQILYETDKNDAIEKINYYARRGLRLIIAGSITSIVILGVMIFLMTFGSISIFWYGGIFIGVSLIGKGLNDFRDKREVIYFFEKKYNLKYT